MNTVGFIGFEYIKSIQPLTDIYNKPYILVTTIDDSEYKTYDTIKYNHKNGIMAQFEII